MSAYNQFDAASEAEILPISPTELQVLIDANGGNLASSSASSWGNVNNSARTAQGSDPGLSTPIQPRTRLLAIHPKLPSKPYKGLHLVVLDLLRYHKGKLEPYTNKFMLAKRLIVDYKQSVSLLLLYEDIFRWLRTNSRDLDYLLNHGSAPRYLDFFQEFEKSNPRRFATYYLETMNGVFAELDHAWALLHAHNLQLLRWPENKSFGKFNSDKTVGELRSCVLNIADLWFLLNQNFFLSLGAQFFGLTVVKKKALLKDRAKSFEPEKLKSDFYFEVSQKKLNLERIGEMLPYGETFPDWLPSPSAYADAKPFVRSTSDKKNIQKNPVTFLYALRFPQLVAQINLPSSDSYFDRDLIQQSSKQYVRELELYKRQKAMREKQRTMGETFYNLVSLAETNKDIALLQVWVKNQSLTHLTRAFDNKTLLHFVNGEISNIETAYFIAEDFLYDENMIISFCKSIFLRFRGNFQVDNFGAPNSSVVVHHKIAIQAAISFLSFSFRCYDDERFRKFEKNAWDMFDLLFFYLFLMKQISVLSPNFFGNAFNQSLVFALLNSIGDHKPQFQITSFVSAMRTLETYLREPLTSKRYNSPGRFG